MLEVSQILIERSFVQLQPTLGEIVRQRLSEGRKVRLHVLGGLCDLF